MEYRNVGTHPVDLDDGRSVGYGEFIDLDDEQVREPLAEELLATGVLVPTDEKGEKEAKLADLRQTAKQKKEAEQEEVDES